MQACVYLEAGLPTRAVTTPCDPAPPSPLTRRRGRRRDIVVTFEVALRHVARPAGCLEVGRVTTWTTSEQGDDVIYLRSHVSAVSEAKLADVTITGEDHAAQVGPCSVVRRPGHTLR
jgi:hypothetical protein